MPCHSGADPEIEEGVGGGHTYRVGCWQLAKDSHHIDLDRNNAKLSVCV